MGTNAIMNDDRSAYTSHDYNAQGYFCYSLEVYRPKGAFNQATCHWTNISAMQPTSNAKQGLAALHACTTWSDLQHPLLVSSIFHSAEEPQHSSVKLSRSIPLYIRPFDDLQAGMGFSLSWPMLGGAVAAYYVTLVFYRLFLHPLAPFPGPRLAAVSRWYEGYYDVVLDGQYTSKIAKLHRTYGIVSAQNKSSMVL